jgi:hypothetical protein
MKDCYIFPRRERQTAQMLSNFNLLFSLPLSGHDRFDGVSKHEPTHLVSPPASTTMHINYLLSPRTTHLSNPAP